METLLKIPSRFLKSGYRVISYSGKKKPVTLECSNGHVFTTSPRRKAYNCPEITCTNFKKVGKNSKEYVKSQIEARGYKWVSGEYKNALSLLDLVCPNNHQIKMHWKSFRENNNCRVCLNFEVVTKERVLQALSKEGYEWQSGEILSSRSKFEIKCPKNHLYIGSWTMFQQGYRCPTCFGSPRYTTEDIRKMSSKWGFTLLSEYSDCNAYLEWLCPKGHKHEQSWKNLREYRGACPICNFSSSQGESQIADWLEGIGLKIIRQSKTILPVKKELDIFLPEHNLAIEHCGIYHHSEKFMPKDYHLDKLKLCLSVGIQLITVFGDEWAFKQEQVKNFILSKLKKNKRVYARSCQIKNPSLIESREFIGKNHIQGYANSHKTWGLYHKDQLVMTLSISRHHRQNSREEWVINRVCTRGGLTVVGGLKRLLLEALDDMKINEVITFADRRYSEGNGYVRTGFVVDSVLKPDYVYIKSNHRHSKQSLRKTKEEKLSGYTEKELRKQQGYLRLWDCGKIHYKFKKDVKP